MTVYFRFSDIKGNYQVRMYGDIKIKTPSENDTHFQKEKHSQNTACIPRQG